MIIVTVLKSKLKKKERERDRQKYVWDMWTLGSLNSIISNTVDMDKEYPL